MPTPDLSLLTDADPRLRQAARPVSWPDAALAEELEALHATLANFRDRTGFGRAMAAPQVGICKRVIVMQLGAKPFALINPEITWRSDETFELWDDCLSQRSWVVRVRRHQSVSLRYRDEHGRLRQWDHLQQEMAELVQHEIDHLEGVLMTDRQSGAGAIQPIDRHAELVGGARLAHRLSLERIARSQKVIPTEFLSSPQYDCEPLSRALGCKLTIKLDFTNPIRSFKGRGASFLVHEAIARKDTRPMVCASAGNWGQAMAYVCRAKGLPLVVYASVDANPLKVRRMQELGAEVRQVGEDFDAAKEAAKAHAARIGGWMVEDGLEPEISEGHGTLAIELLSRGDAFDAITVPLGNGAMLNGIARWFKAASPATQVLGVSAATAPAMELSWRSGDIVSTKSANTIADGIAVRVPIAEAVKDMHGLVDDVLLVDDHHIVQALRLVHAHAGLQLEPAGAVGVAAILAHRERFAGRHVATVLCGSNITQHQVKEYLQ